MRARTPRKSTHDSYITAVLLLSFLFLLFLTSALGAKTPPHPMLAISPRIAPTAARFATAATTTTTTAARVFAARPCVPRSSTSLTNPATPPASRTRFISTTARASFQSSPQRPSPPAPTAASKMSATGFKVTDWVDPKDNSGEFKRQVSSFRDWIGKADETGAVPFPAEKGRYHLYVSYACPWVCWLPSSAAVSCFAQWLIVVSFLGDAHADCAQAQGA